MGGDAGAVKNNISVECVEVEECMIGNKRDTSNQERPHRGICPPHRQGHGMCLNIVNVDSNG